MRPYVYHEICHILLHMNHTPSDRRNACRLASRSRRLAAQCTCRPATRSPGLRSAEHVVRPSDHSRASKGSSECRAFQPAYLSPSDRLHASGRHRRTCCSHGEPLPGQSIRGTLAPCPNSPDARSAGPRGRQKAAVWGRPAEGVIRDSLARSSRQNDMRHSRSTYSGALGQGGHGSRPRAS